MTNSLPLATFRAEIESICENPQELIVTKQGQPVFTLLPYEMYQSLIETLDIVADREALSTLQQNLAELKAGRLAKVRQLSQCSEKSTGAYKVGLTHCAYQALQEMSEHNIEQLTQAMKNLGHAPQTQGKALVGSLKGYRSIKTQEDHYQIIYFIETKQVVVVFVASAVVQPNAPLLHLLK